MKFRNFISMIRYDVSEGILHRWKYYFTAILFFSFANAVFAYDARSFCHGNSEFSRLGVIDFIVNMFAGNEPFNKDARTGIKLSMLWFGFHAFLAIIVGFYVNDNLKKSSTSYILRVKSKRQWWTCKVIWCVIAVFVYYVLFFLVALVSAMIYSGNLSLENPMICRKFFSINIETLDLAYLFCISVFLPLIISVAISIFQITLGLVINPIYSFLVVISYLMISAFYCNKFLLFNFTMIRRNPVFLAHSKIVPSNGFLFAVLLAIISYFAGIAVIKKKDII